MTDSGVSLHNVTRRADKLLTRIFVYGPLIALVWAIIQVWGYGVDWFYLSLLGLFYAWTALGVTVGNHRYFTHGAFKAKPFLESALVIAGSMAVEKPVLEWVGTHRLHHQTSDTESDPHSPYKFGHGGLAIVRGFFHAHVGWLFSDTPPEYLNQIKDLRKQPRVVFLSGLFPLWVTLGILLPAFAGALYERSWHGFFLGFLWGGLVRIALVHHVTWSINSVCHIWGNRPYKTGKDCSTNNLLFAILGLGEGWHNNHHAYPSSARHGFYWWQFDLSWLFIRLCQKLGWVWDIKIAPPAESASKSSFRT
jgi:stearoyl-CoA desaturase (delta-9 desaturase)